MGRARAHRQHREPGRGRFAEVRPLLREGLGDRRLQSHCPGCGEGKVNSQAPQSSVTFPVNGVKWAGSCNKPGDCDPPPDQCSECCLATGSNKMPTVDFNYSIDYVKVTLATGCKFSLETDWQIGGRYGASDPGDRYVKNVDAPCPNNMPFSPTGDACWVSTGSSNTGTSRSSTTATTPVR